MSKVYDAGLVSDNDITSGGRWSGLVLRRVAGECTGYVVRRVRESEWVARLRSVAVYRARKAPRDLARLVWFLLRGHGRWIAKGLVVLALAEKVFDRAAMPEWLVTLYQVRDFLDAAVEVGGRGCSRSSRWAGWWRRCGKAGTARRVRGG